MRLVRLSIAAITWIAVFSIAGRPSTAFAQTDHDALALKFIHFLVKTETTWPKKIAPGKRNPAKVLLLGDKEMEEAYKLIIRNDKDKSIPIEVVPSRNITLRDLQGVHLVYFGDDTTREELALLKQIDGKPTLTVGVSPNFLNEGGMMQFRIRQETGKERIHVNLNRITESGLKVGASFLRLTTVVKP